MSQTDHRDIEGGNHPVNDHGDNSQSPLGQPSQGESNSRDSSASLFSVYYNAADIEDNKMVESWQKDADGILFFTGLFSAAVAALLAVTVQDLKPNSQDISAFYLGNIYEVLADPNTTRASIPSPSVKPPPFSPPRHAIWVNSLWFLSLVISVSCALLATSLQQWARRYIKLTQPALCSPEKRARMHAFFAEGADKMHISWAVEVLPTMLHVSVFLFFGGLVVFLINLDHQVFSSVVWWIGLFTILYGSITVMPIVRHDSPYCAPLSRFAWFLYASTRHVYIKILASELIRSANKDSKKRFRTLKKRYRSWVSEGVEKAAEEIMLERSSKIDIRIFDWTISALGDDKSLEEFFEAIPGFFNSEPMKNIERDFPETLLKTFWAALNEFMGRTSSSNLFAESDKSRRVTICRDIMNVIPCPSPISYDNLHPHLDRSPLPTWSLQAMTRWFTHASRSVSDTARTRAIELLPSVQKRDEHWIAVASDAYGLSRRNLQDMVSLGGNNVLLSILINISRRTIRSNFREWEVLKGLTRFDILNTLPLLQHDFCALWNDIVQEARNQGSFRTPCDILHGLRHLYLSLHQGTDAAPTAFSASTDDLNHVLFLSWSYPFCNIPGHRPRSTFIIPSPTVPFPTQPGDSLYPSPHQSTLGAISPSGQASIAGPPWPSIHSSPLPIDVPPSSDVAAAMQSILLTATFSHSPEGDQQQDIAISNNEGMSFTGPTPGPARMPTPVRVPAPVPNASSTSWDAYPASTSNFTSRTPYVVDFPVPASHPSSQPPPQGANLITLLSEAAPSHLANTNTTRRLRALGIVNSGNKCFANAVLELLAHCPPFWNLFKDRSRLIGQQGLGEGRWQESGDCATPLVDATTKFLDEFVYKETPSVMQQPQQKAGKGKSKEDEEEKKEPDTVDSLELTYIHDVMKEKRQLNSLLRDQQQDAAEFLDLYLEALDEELIMLQTSMSTLKPASTSKVEELEDQGIGQTEVGEQNYTVRPSKSPISRIFGGRSRSIARAPNQPDTITVKDWRLLQLNIQPDPVHTIEDALVQILQPQTGKIDQSSPSKASQHVQIETLPPVLVLHLKRFLYDAAADGTIKISKPVHFTPELEVSPEIMASVSGKSAELAHYKLYGVLYHRGKSTGSGRYSVDVLHPSGDGGSGETWLHIDDEAARTVRHEDVFGDHDNERVDDPCAYMLFYCRTAPTGPTRT